MEINKQNLKRYIPTAIKREVRKRCGFGCVICGSALTHYDHFDPEFEFASEHCADGIVALCHHHHGQKDKGLLTNEQIRGFNDEPYAIKKRQSTDQFVNQFAPEIIIGRRIFAGGTSVIKMDGEVVLGFKAPEEEGSPVRLSFSFFDRTGAKVFSVIDNEIICEVEAYDIESVGGTWTVRSKKGQIDLVIRFDLPTRITIERLHFRKGRWELIVNGPEVNLTYDGKKSLSIDGWGSFYGPCLFELQESSPNILIRDIDFGCQAPSPLGSIPNASGNGFSFAWPVIAVLDLPNRDPHIYKCNGTEYIGFFLQSRDAHKSVKENQVLVLLDPKQCVALIRYASTAMNVNKVSFNPGLEDYSAFTEANGFIAPLAQIPNLSRNDECFCGSKNRFKSCHGAINR